MTEPDVDALTSPSLADELDSGPAEATLVGRAQDGDVEAFETLVQRYQGRVFRLAYRMLFDRAESEDVVQDTLVTVWRRLPALVDPAAFRGWLYQIATRRCLSILRTRARRNTQAVEQEQLQDHQDHAQLERAPSAEDPATVAEYRAQLQGLDQVLTTLPDDQRACWVLRELHDLTYPEIAYAMNLPVSTVRGRIVRARQNLAKGMTTWR